MLNPSKMRGCNILRTVFFLKASSRPICLIFITLLVAITVSPARAQDHLSNNEAAELQHAVELLQSNKLDEAEPILRNVIRTNPKNADAHNLLGAVMDQRGDILQAEREYRAALRFNPNSVSAMANLGVLLAH